MSPLAAAAPPAKKPSFGRDAAVKPTWFNKDRNSKCQSRAARKKKQESPAASSLPAERFALRDATAAARRNYVTGQEEEVNFDAPPTCEIYSAETSEAGRQVVLGDS